MFGPGTYRPDPTEGITAIADLPPPEIVPYSRTHKRQAPGSRGCGHEWEFLLRRCTSLYHQGDLRYDGTSQKLCRRGSSWPLLFSTSVRWPTCLWCWGSSASSTSLHLLIP